MSQDGDNGERKSEKETSHSCFAFSELNDFRKSSEFLGNVTKYFSKRLNFNGVYEPEEFSGSVKGCEIGVGECRK